MGRTTPLNEEMQERARKLYVPGVFGYKAVAKQLGISSTSVRRYVDAKHRERDLEYSREAKRRRGGTCEDCGAPTRYNGHKDLPVSLLCKPCAAVRSGKEKEFWTEEVLISRIREWEALYGEPPAVPDWNPNKSREMNDEPRALRFEEANGHWPWFNLVARKFGTWNAAIEAAGFTPRVSGGGGGNICRRRDVKCEGADS